MGGVAAAGAEAQNQISPAHLALAREQNYPFDGHIGHCRQRSPEPETPPPGHHLPKIKTPKIFKRPKNRKDGSVFDD